MKITLDPKLTASPEYIGATHAGRGVWLNLLLWCAEQENAGIINGAASWSDEAWGMLGVSKEMLLWTGRLVYPIAADVFVWGYPIEQEKYLQRARELGRQGGLAKSKAHVNNPRVPSSPPSRVPTRVPSDYEPEIPESLKTDEFMQTWREWLRYRRLRKLAAYKPQSLDKQLAELSDWGHDEAIRSINDSIRQQWQGLFPPKNSAAGGRKASFA